MKKINYIVGSLLLVGLITFFGCKKDNPTDPSPQDQRTNDMAASSWSAESVTLDGTDVTASYSNFSLTFSGKNYSTNNGAPAWKASGTYDFDNGNVNSIILDGNVTATISGFVAGEKMTMRFTITEENAKTSGVGEYVFSLVANN